MRLFWLILLLMLIAAIVPTVMVGWTSVDRTRELLMRDAQELAQERVEKLRLKAERAVHDPTQSALTLARVPAFFQLPLAEQQSQIASVLKQQPEIAVITLYGADRIRLPGLQGFAVTDISPSELASHDARSFALLPGLTELRYSEVYWSPARGAPAVTVAFPLGDPAKGYVTAEIGLGGLSRTLVAERVGSRAVAYVVDANGRLVAGPGLDGVEVGASLTARPAVAHLLELLEASPGAAFHVGNFGEGESRVVGAYSVMADLGWAVISEQPIELAYRQVSTMERQIAFGVGSASLVAIALAALFSRTLSRPLKKFDAAAMQIARGQFGVQVELSAKNELGALAKTFNYMSAQIEAFDHETKRLYDSLERGYLETIVALANSIDSKDAYTRGHSQRVGDMAVEIGRELGMSERDLKLLHYGGILHDIGKIGIVESILLKQTRLTEEEMVTMRDHPIIGDTIIQPVTFLASVRSAVRSHHERWDGTGYPDGLKGEQIPLIARIVNAADTFDACTSTRPYQKAVTLQRAMEIIDGLRGTQLDPRVLHALRTVVEKRRAKGGGVEPSRQAG